MQRLGSGKVTCSDGGEQAVVDMVRVVAHNSLTNHAASDADSSNQERGKKVDGLVVIREACKNVLRRFRYKLD